MEERSNVTESLERLTADVRRLLERTEDEPVGVMTAYHDALLRLTEAVDRLAHELESRGQRS